MAYVCLPTRLLWLTHSLVWTNTSDVGKSRVITSSRPGVGKHGTPPCDMASPPVTELSANNPLPPHWIISAHESVIQSFPGFWCILLLKVNVLVTVAEGVCIHGGIVAQLSWDLPAPADPIRLWCARAFALPVSSQAICWDRVSVHGVSLANGGGAVTNTGTVLILLQGGESSVLHHMC